MPWTKARRGGVWYVTAGSVEAGPAAAREMQTARMSGDTPSSFPRLTADRHRPPRYVSV
jgi:hypothetical protein